MITKIEILRKAVVESGIMSDNEFTEKHNNDEFNCFLKAMEEFANVFEKEISDFEQASRPLMKYLGENHHPHTSAYIRNDRAELLEGLESFGTDDYIQD